MTEFLSLKTWQSLRVLDVISGSILARPFASVSSRPSTCSSGADNGRDTVPQIALIANFDMCSIIEDVLRHLEQQRELDFFSTEDLLQRLSQWSANLPAEIRLSSLGPTFVSSQHSQVIGNIHVACLYYFTTMLLTRPFLIQFLMSRLPNISHQASGGVISDSQELSKIAQVSIDAAKYMSQICHNALSAGLLLDNMCILK